jgi:Fructose-2,6-bisphosphatase
MQARMAADCLNNKHFDIIYTSNLWRAEQTARIIEKNRGIDIVIRNDLREIEMGAWEGMTWSEIESKYKDFFIEWKKHMIDLTYPDGESGGDALKRALKVIDEIISGGYENAAVVTSGGIIMVLLSYFLGLGLERRFNMEIENCSISVVSCDRETKKFKVKCINNTSHLDIEGAL